METEWICHDGPTGYQHRISDVHGRTVCDVIAARDAALLKAAPRLLFALRHMVEWYAHRENASTHGLNVDGDKLLPFDEQENEVQIAMTAIAEATGRTG